VNVQIPDFFFNSADQLYQVRQKSGILTFFYAYLLIQ